MQHLEEGTIHAWLDGALSAAEQASVEQHVRQCAECAAMVAEARGMIAGAARIVSALDVVPGGVIPQRQAASKATVPVSLWRSLRLTPLRAGLAASLMIAAASLFAVRREAIVAVKDSTAPQIAVASPAPQPAPTVKPQPASPPAAKRKAPQIAALAPALPVMADAKASARDSLEATRDQLSAARLGAAAGGANSAVETRRAFPQLSEVSGRAVSVRPVTFAGCYQIVRDSLYSPSMLPDRFALDAVTDSEVVRNVVRAVAPSGRMDTALTNADWKPTGPAMVNVSLTVGTRRQDVRMFRSGPSLVAEVPGRTQPLRVTRTACNP